MSKICQKRTCKKYVKNYVKKEHAKTEHAKKTSFTTVAVVFIVYIFVCLFCCITTQLTVCDLKQRGFILASHDVLSWPSKHIKTLHHTCYIFLKDINNTCFCFCSFVLIA